MRLAELFPEGGRGVIGTASSNGDVNMAVFATPHVIDEETLAWGISDGRSYQNLKENGKASYLYMAPSRGYTGWRVTLTLKEIRNEGALLEEIRASADKITGGQAAATIKHVAFFKVEEVRPLL